MSLTKVKAGNILLTTPGASSNDVTPATTQYVTTAIGNLVDTAPSTLNTLNELAAALGDDVNFSTTVTNSIATKLPLAGGTLTGALNISGTSALSTEFKIGNLTWNQNSSSTHGLLHQYRGSDGYSELQINNTASSGAVTLNIRNNSASVATIANDGGAYFAGKVGIGTTTIPHGGIGRAKFAITGTAGDAQGPHLQYTTDADNYPVFQQLNWTHDNISLNFDSYYDGDWRSSDAGSNFQIYKNTDLFSIKYDSGIAAGSAITWNDGFVMKSDGNVGIGTDSPLNKFVVAHESHGVAIDYVGATLPAQAGLFTSSTAHTQTAYGDLNIKARSDYGPNYGVGFFTANSANAPTLRMKIAADGNVGITAAASLRFNTTADNTHAVGYDSTVDGSFIRGQNGVRVLTGTGSGTEQLRVNATGVGIGENDPQTKLHVYGDDPVIRVSDDGTSGFSTLELRQQNTTNEGFEISYNSGTGHTHLNNVYSSGDTVFGTSTGSFGTTSTNVRMKITHDGYVTMPYQPSFKIAWGNRSATGSARLLSTDAGDSVASGRDQHNTGNHFNTATGKFTAPIAGTYLLGFQAMRHGSNGTLLECRIKKNGAFMWARAYQAGFTHSHQYWNIVTITNCAAGDYFQVFLHASTSIYDDDTYFYGHLMG